MTTQKLEKRERHVLAMTSLTAKQEEIDRIGALERAIAKLEADMPNALAMLTKVAPVQTETNDRNLSTLLKAAAPLTALKRRAERLFEAAMKVEDRPSASRAYQLSREANELEIAAIARAQRHLNAVG
ncbi:MAG: hypothetical protein AAGH41_08985 [Pseudomonadota bacterium]